MSVGAIVGRNRRTWTKRLGRAGLVARGVLYGVVGILAVRVALGGREESPDREGALRTISEQPFGKGLLLALAAGLAGYALWQLSRAIWGDLEGDDAKGIAKRAGALARAVWYGILSALTLSTIGGGDGGGGSEQKTTAGVFDLPAGRYLVYGAGLAFVGAALFNGWRGVTCRFNKKLKTGEMSDAEEAAATGVGVLGYLARFVVFALVGVFLLRAAWEFDPKRARGLDGALLEVAQAPYGGLLLGAVAVGLLSYALYCFVQARYRKL